MSDVGSGGMPSAWPDFRRQFNYCELSDSLKVWALGADSSAPAGGHLVGSGVGRTVRGAKILCSML